MLTFIEIGSDVCFSNQIFANKWKFFLRDYSLRFYTDFVSVFSLHSSQKYAYCSLQIELHISALMKSLKATKPKWKLQTQFIEEMINAISLTPHWHRLSLILFVGLVYMKTIQLYWWRKTSGAPPCIISCTSWHLSRTNDVSYLDRKPA